MQKYEYSFVQSIGAAFYGGVYYIAPTGERKNN